MATYVTYKWARLEIIIIIWNLFNKSFNNFDTLRNVILYILNLDNCSCHPTNHIYNNYLGTPHVLAFNNVHLLVSGGMFVFYRTIKTEFGIFISASAEVLRFPSTFKHGN